jgi:hypothetical protein
MDGRQHLDASLSAPDAARFGAAWTTHRTFENGTPGTKAKGLDAFDGAGAWNTYSTDRARPGGSQSCKTVFVAGATGDPETMGVIKGSGGLPYMTSGDEVWVRAYVWLDSGWEFTANPATKFIRVIGDANNGSIYLHTSGDIEYANEVAPVNLNTASPGSGVSMPIGQWVCMEMYIKLSEDRYASEAKIWRNGVEILDLQDAIAANPFMASKAPVATLKPGGYRTEIYFWSYWNGGAPKNLTAYWDDIKVHVRTGSSDAYPSNVDASGDPMIGPDNWGGGR